MLCCQFFWICNYENTHCFIFQCAHFMSRKQRVDTTDVSGNIAGVEEKNRVHFHCLHFPLAGTAHPLFKGARGASWILYHTSARCSVHTLHGDSLLSEYTSRVTKKEKETKGTENKNKKRECTALQECPLSLRRFLELTGFLLIVIDHHWWTLNEEVIIHWYGK